MKNLKKVLAFALVVCMMLSTIVSATAISATDYTDYSTIKNADQVAVLTELGVINGYPDESFKPEKTVSRAEMAKMITVILNKGTEAAGNYDGAQVFSDVYADMWCKGYINYCNTLGIVVGMGDGTYKPNQGVTVVQTAKMLLVAMGYDPVVEGFEGANWEVNVSAIAAQAGLYNGVTANAAAECSRDTAALIIYNALVANTVDGYTNGKAVVGDKTMLGKYFNAVVVTGVVVANDYANLFGSSALYNAKHASTELAILGSQYVDDDDAIDPGISFFKNAWEYDESYPIGFTKSFVDEYGNNDYYESQIFETATSLEQVGQTVKVVAQLKDNYDYYYKNGVRYADYTFNGKVIGKAMDVDCVVKEYVGEYALIDNASLKKEGIVIDSTTRYFVNYSAAWEQFGYPSRYSLEYDPYTALGFYNPNLIEKLSLKEYTIDGVIFNPDGGYTKIVDVDGDGIAEMILQSRPFFAIAEYDSYFKTYSFDYDFEEYTKYDGLYSTLISDFAADYSSVDPDDIICDDDIDDGDKVLVVPVDGKFYVEVCESKKVTVDTVSIDAEKKDYVKVDGTTYYESGLYWAYQTYRESKGYQDSINGKDDQNDLYWDLSACDTDEDYIFYFDSYGNVVAYEEDKGPKSSGVYALVTASYIKDNGAKDDDYYLYLTKGGEKKSSYVEVQWMGSRYPEVDSDALPFFAYNGPVDTVTYLPFHDAWMLRDYYDQFTGNYLSTSLIKGENAFFVDYPGSFYASIDYIYNNGVLGVYGDDNYSFGYYSALIRTGYNDDGDVDVKALDAIQDFGKDSSGNFINTSVTAGQWTYTASNGRTYYATSDTVFFIYQYDADTGKVKDIYSFTGYRNLPAIGYEWECTCTMDGCTCTETKVCATCIDAHCAYCTVPGDPVYVCEHDCAADAVAAGWDWDEEEEEGDQGHAFECTCNATGTMCVDCTTLIDLADNGHDCTAEHVATYPGMTTECKLWRAYGISAMYGEVENGGGNKNAINALVIETNQEFTKVASDYVFIYNFIEKSGSGQKLRYLVNAVDQDGNDVDPFWVDAYSGHCEDLFDNSGNLIYGMYARFECDNQYLTDETLYDVESTGYSYMNATLTAQSFDYTNKYVVFTGTNGVQSDKYYVTENTNMFYNCAVIYNNSTVINYSLAKTDKDGLFPDGPPNSGKYQYCSTYLVIYKNSVIDGEAVKEAVAIIGGYKNPMVYNKSSGKYAERGSANAGGYEYMTSDYGKTKTKGTFEHFSSLVAPKAGGPGDAIAPADEQ